MRDIGFQEITLLVKNTKYLTIFPISFWTSVMALRIAWEDKWV